MKANKTTYRDTHHHLIAQCKKGEQRAQIQLYKLYYKAMFNSSLRIVKSKADAEDIMQDSFLDAFSRIAQYKEEGSFGGWLKRIVINNSLDFINKYKAQSMNENLEIVDPDDPHEIPDADIKLKDIKTALEHIKDDYRIIISLYLFEGFDHEEIGNILHISYNLSRTRYSRAKKKLLDEIRLIQEERSTKWA